MKNRLNPQGSGGFFMKKERVPQKFSAKHSIFYEVNDLLIQ